MTTKTHFEISAEWMKACGFGDSARIVKVLKIEQRGTCTDGTVREVVVVEHPMDTFHSEWVVCPFMGGRGKFVEAPKPKAPANITPVSLALFLAYAEDAGNWSGQPLVGGNVGGSKEDRGNLTQLKRAKLITTCTDEGCTWLSFTDAGKALAAEHNIKL